MCGMPHIYQIRLDNQERFAIVLGVVTGTTTLPIIPDKGFCRRQEFQLDGGFFVVNYGTDNKKFCRTVRCVSK